MTSVTEYRGRRIERRHGAGDQVSYTVVTDHLHYFQLIGSTNGTPGPVTMIVGGMQSHVSAADRFGETFDLDYVKRWIDTEEEARGRVREALAAPEPIDVVCPACNARPGKPCTAPTDTSRRPVGWMHASRTEAVQ